MNHDFDGQKAETFDVFAELSRKHPLPAEAALDFQFIPGEGEADWMAFEEAAKALGHEVRRYEDEDWIEVTTGPLALSAASIWAHERVLTQMALDTGFLPDGWGFGG